MKIIEKICLFLIKICLKQIGKNSNIVSHAKRELTLAGYDLSQTKEDPNKWMSQNILDLLRLFSSQGHSGSSAPYCIKYFEKLASFKNLIPLTGKDEEWIEVGDGIFQNKRCSHVFKENGQAYDIDGKVFVDSDGCSFTNKESRVDIKFPYDPNSVYILTYQKNI